MNHQRQRKGTRSIRNKTTLGQEEKQQSRLWNRQRPWRELPPPPIPLSLLLFPQLLLHLFCLDWVGWFHEREREVLKCAQQHHEQRAHEGPSDNADRHKQEKGIEQKDKKKWQGENGFTKRKERFDDKTTNEALTKVSETTL